MWVQTCFPSHFLVVGYTNRSTVCYICYNNVTIMLQYSNTNTLHCINDILIYFLYIHICKYIYIYVYTHTCMYKPWHISKPQRTHLGSHQLSQDHGLSIRPRGHGPWKNVALLPGHILPINGGFSLGKTSGNHGELLPKMEVLMEKRSINRRCSSVCQVC